MPARVENHPYGFVVTEEGYTKANHEIAQKYGKRY